MRGWRAGPLLLPADAAQLANLDYATLYRLLRSGELPSVVRRGRLHVPRCELMAWIEARTSRFPPPDTPDVTVRAGPRAAREQRQRELIRS